MKFDSKLNLLFEIILMLIKKLLIFMIKKNKFVKKLSSKNEFHRLLKKIKSIF